MAEKYNVPSIPKSRPAVVWWAWIGGAWLLFWAYVLIRWVTGPYFVPVPVGPVEPAGWSKAIMDTWQILSLPLLALGGYFMIYRPYKKTRNVPLDGLLLIAFVLFSLQDAGSNYLGIWYTVNSYMLNMGSFYNEIPGWLGFGRPGAVVPYAYLFHITEYPLGLFTFCFIGSGLMNFARKRWNWGPVKLIIFIFPFMMLYDLVIEGTFQTLGLYTMAGGKISFFPDTYEKFPLIEMIWIACLNIPVLALRYFKNDKGETLVERGVNTMVVSDLKKQVLRCLALIGVCQTIFLTCYNIPVALTMGSNPGEWPSDIITRPYLTNGLCGPTTDRLCPGPGVPLTQQAWVTTLPAGQPVPEETWNSRFFEPSVGKALRRDDGKKNPELTDGKYRKYRPFNSKFLGYSGDRCDTLFCIEGRKPNLP